MALASGSHRDFCDDTTFGCKSLHESLSEFSVISLQGRLTPVMAKCIVVSINAAPSRLIRMFVENKTFFMRKDKTRQ